MQVIAGRADQSTETVYRVFCLEEILSSWRLRSYRKTGGNKVGSGQEQQGVEAPGVQTPASLLTQTQEAQASAGAGLLESP